jgi:hypothetical protein
MDVKQNVRNIDTWLRGLFIIVFAVIFYFLVGIIWLLVIFQFLTTVITGKLNNQLENFSGVLTDYALQILDYVTYQSDVKPFPFSPLPDQEGNKNAPPAEETPVAPGPDTGSDKTKKDS